MGEESELNTQWTMTDINGGYTFMSLWMVIIELKIP